jgi:hypothetical protein
MSWRAFGESAGLEELLGICCLGRPYNYNYCPGPDTITPRDQIPQEGNPSLRQNVLEISKNRLA